MTAEALAASVAPSARVALDSSKSSVFGGIVLGYLVRKVVIRLLPWLLEYLAVFLLNYLITKTIGEIITMLANHKARATNALPAPYLSPEP